MERRNLFALGSFALAAVLTAIGTFGGDDDHDIGEWLFVLAVSLVAAVVVFWLAAPRWRGSERASLVLAVLSAISIVVFWSGLPSVLAGGAALLALDARADGRGTAAGLISLLIAAGTVVAAVILAFTG